MADSSSARNSVVHWVDHEDGVYDLARWVRSPERSVPIVCVTVQPRLDQPLVDVDALAREVGEQAEVWVVPVAKHQWMLTDELPKGLDVYGGAVRVWWPIDDVRQVQPRDHPTFAVFTPEDAERAARDVAAHVTQPRQAERSAGDDVVGVVTAVHPNGADVRLASGHLGFVANAHMAENAEIYHAAEVVREGQEVRLRISDDAHEAGRDRLRVSMRPFAPDPWQRIIRVYPKGSIVEAIVLRFTPFGAFVELLPGAEGLIHKSQISDDFVDHIPDYLREGQRIAVRINDVNAKEGRAELTLRGFPADAPAEPVASLYEDGPPWLPVYDDDAAGHAEAADSGDAGAEDETGDSDAREGRLREELAAARERVDQLERQLAQLARDRF